MRPSLIVLGFAIGRATAFWTEVGRWRVDKIIVGALVLSGVMLLLGGCAGFTGAIEAVGKDPANVCVSITTPYGGLIQGRVNTPLTRMTVSGGTCTVETPR